MKFSIIGYGFVGKAMEHALSTYHETTIYDPYLGYDKFDVTADGYVICTATPEGASGRCDSSAVYETVKIISEHNPEAHVLIKSTTDIPTLLDCQDTLPQVVFSPEYLRGTVGANPTKEFMETGFAIYGGDDGRWWHNVFSQIVPVDNVRFTDIQTAGFIKYSENSYLALKVTFFNELFQLYESIGGMNYDMMVEALALDKRIGMSHTQVPGPDGKMGFGGHCLPKDTAEFTGFARSVDQPLELLEKAREINSKIRK